jgi:hypothetical protein
MKCARKYYLIKYIQTTKDLNRSFSIFLGNAVKFTFKGCISLKLAYDSDLERTY